MSTEKIYRAVLRVAASRLSSAASSGQLSILDIGAGEGRLLEKLMQVFPKTVCARACDFHTERFELGSVPIARVDLNHEALPYKSGAFDLVTCSEVIEHLENYYALLHEAYRVLKHGGLLVLTTPNVLNMKSRLRYFGSGFANLFGPLPIRNDERYSTNGHINPIPYFYLARALAEAGFSGIQLDIDKLQKTSLALLAFLYPIWWLAWESFLGRERRKYRTLSPENEPYVKAHGAGKLLTGRTIVVSAVKGQPEK
jgi:ubiquinone/menaquinone biosynthesis C-methylase UbiE